LTRDALEQARVQVAKLVNAQPGQVIFTSGGTEANNLAIKGVLASKAQGRIATSAIEHASVLEVVNKVVKAGWKQDVIGVNSNGQITESSFLETLHEDTRMASVMLANNETGVIQDVANSAKTAKTKGIIFHTDASQAAGKIAVDFSALGVNLMTLSSHKIYGPQGVGALIADRAIEIGPQLQGGGQERGLRSGTENIAGITGFGMAAELAVLKLEQRSQQLSVMRDALTEALSKTAGITLFSADVERLPNTVLFSVEGFDGEALLMQLDRKSIAVSSGSACDSSKTAPSHVLMAMGVSEQVARNTIRVSFGKDNQAEDVDKFMDALMNIIT
jgi:cysteine desulfurase